MSRSTSGPGIAVSAGGLPFSPRKSVQAARTSDLLPSSKTKSSFSCPFRRNLPTSLRIRGLAGGFGPFPENVLTARRCGDHRRP